MHISVEGSLFAVSLSCDTSVNVCKYKPAQYRCCVCVIRLPGSFVLIFQLHSGLHLYMLYVDELCNRKERSTEQPFPLHLNLTASSSVRGASKVKDGKSEAGAGERKCGCGNEVCVCVCV